MSFDIETNQRDKKMYKTISLFVLLGLLSGCNYEQKNVTNAVLDQPAAKMTLQELEKYTDTAVRNSLNDSCWFFLTEKEGGFFIEESEEVPLMRVYIEKGKEQLNVSYGQEGFLFYIVDNKLYSNGMEYHCLDNPEGTDTLLVKAEILSSGIVVWKIPNPYTVADDYETIFTVPESGMSAYLTSRDSSSIDNSVSEKNN